MAISRSIVQAVRSLDPPGRFLEKDPATGIWADVGHRKGSYSHDSTDFFGLPLSLISYFACIDFVTYSY
jgi:hypothetical protein